MDDLRRWAVALEKIEQGHRDQVTAAERAALIRYGAGCLLRPAGVGLRVNRKSVDPRELHHTAPVPIDRVAAARKHRR